MRDDLTQSRTCDERTDGQTNGIPVGLSVMRSAYYSCKLTSLTSGKVIG